VWKKYKTEILIFCLAFGVRFIYAMAVWFLYGQHPFIAYSDAESFIRAAENILSHGVFSESYSAPFIPDSLRTPGYSLFLGLFLWLKVSFAGIAIIQNFFAGITAVLIYRLAKLLFFSGSAGVVAALIFSLEPVSIYWSNLLMSDSLFGFLLISAVYLFAKNRLYWFAAVLGLSALVRPVGLYFFPLFLTAYSLRVYFEKSQNIFSVSKKALIMICVFLAVLSPWFLRNKIVFDSWEFSSAGWVNLTIFTLSEFGRQNQILVLIPSMAPDYPGRGATYEDDRDLRNINFYKNQFTRIVFGHPWEYFKFHFGSAVKVFNYHGYQYLAKEVLQAKISGFSDRAAYSAVSAGNALWLLIYGFAVFGFWKREARFWQIFFAALIILNVLLLGNNGLMQGGRYSLPVMPFVLLLGGYGIWIFKKSFDT